MNYLKNNRGLSLVELLVGMIVLGIIMAAITPLFSTVLTATSRGMVKNDMIQEGRWAVDLIAKELSGIDISTITVPASSAPTTPPTIVKKPTLSFTKFDSTEVITYSVVNNEVCRKVGTGINRPLTDTSRSKAVISFIRNSNDNESIDIQLTLSAPNNNYGVPDEIITTTIYPLNTGKSAGQ